VRRERPAPPAGVRRTRAGAVALVAVLAAGAVAEHVQEDRRIERKAADLTRGSPAAGRRLALERGCGGCHTIPGVAGAQGRVGPPLAGFAGRAYVGGVLTNSPDHLVAWLRNPRAIDPRTAMPAVGLDEQAARDLAAFLYTLD
jgi:cytochrome c2